MNKGCMTAMTTQSVREVLQIFLRRIFLTIFGSLALAGCNTITPFDRIAYEKATDAKVAALTVMSRGVNSFASEKDAVLPLMVRVDEAYEYDRGRSLNSNTIKMWEILLSPDGRLYGRFLSRWQDGKAFTKEAIQERKADVAKGFDLLIALERGKRVAIPAE